MGTKDLDHIKPLAVFDLTDSKQLAEACHYTNMRPLWSSANRSRPKDGSDEIMDNGMGAVV